jgi:hypothetical protein
MRDEQRQRSIEVGDVVARVHGYDALHRPSAGDVDPGYLRVRVRAPHESRVKRTGGLNVIDVLASAAYEAVILVARDRGPECSCRHRQSPPLERFMRSAASFTASTMFV